MPNRKVVAGALAGAISVIAVWVASLAGLAVPPEVASAFTTLVGFVVAYLVPERMLDAAADEEAVTEEVEPVIAED